MSYQHCKLCGTRSDAFGCYDRCTFDGPWHEWDEDEIDDFFKDMKNAVEALRRGEVIASQATRQLAKRVLESITPCKGCGGKGGGKEECGRCCGDGVDPQ